MLPFYFEMNNNTEKKTFTSSSLFIPHFQKLDKFIIEFNQLKAMRQRNSNKQSENTKTDKAELTTETTPSKMIGNDVDEIFYDCNEEEITQRKTDRFLKAASYASIVYIYAQLSLLVYLVSLSTLKLGILFMFVCVAAIAYFIMKVSFCWQFVF